MNDELEKIECKFIGERVKAFILEHEDGTRDFFPKSQVSFERRNVKTGECIAIIPIWLLDQKGWQ